MRTSKLGDNNSAVGAIVVDVGGGHPHAGQPRAVTLLDVVRLQQTNLHELPSARLRTDFRYPLVYPVLSQECVHHPNVALYVPPGRVHCAGVSDVEHEHIGWKYQSVGQSHVITNTQRTPSASLYLRNSGGGTCTLNTSSLRPLASVLLFRISRFRTPTSCCTHGHETQLLSILEFEYWDIKGSSCTEQLWRQSCPHAGSWP